MAGQMERKHNRRQSDEEVEVTDKAAAGEGRSLLGRLASVFGGRASDRVEQVVDDENDPIGSSALLLMRSLDVRLTPLAFQLFYTHIAGERPDLSAEIEAMRQRDEKFSAGRIAQLHERFFGAEQESLAVYEASRNVERMLTVLQDELELASGDTARHGKAISELNDQLGRQDKVAEIRKLVAGIVDETANMRMSINKLERRVVKGTTEIAVLRDNLEKAQREANSDPLTGIGNRKVLELTLKRCSVEAAKGDRPFCLLLMDIDHFKKFNDDYGHQVGDLVLQRVAHTSHQSVKARDLAARYGGEELAIVLVETKLDQAVKFAESLRQRIEAIRFEADDVKQKVRPVTVSIGVAEFADQEPLKRLIGRADKALYHAKSEGRNMVASQRDIEVHGRPKAKPRRQPSKV